MEPFDATECPSIKLCHYVYHVLLWRGKMS